MTAKELCAKWAARSDEYRRLGVLADGAALCEEALADLRKLLDAESDTTLNLTEAARISGYSREHLGRLLDRGVLKNVGRPGAPRVRRVDLPKKPRTLSGEGLISHIAGASSRQIVRSVVDS